MSKKHNAKVLKGNEKKKTKENEKFSKAQLTQIQSMLNKSLKSKEEEEETEVDKWIKSSIKKSAKKGSRSIGLMSTLQKFIKKDLKSFPQAIIRVVSGREKKKSE